MIKCLSLISLISMFTLSACQVGHGGAISSSTPYPTLTPIPTANPSSSVMPEPTQAPLSAPQNLKLTEVFLSGFEIEWLPVVGAEDYIVYYAGRAQVRLSETQYRAVNLGLNKSFDVQVQAVNAQQIGSLSQAVRVTTLGPSPSPDLPQATPTASAPLCIRSDIALAQNQASIKGTIFDENNQPVQNALIKAVSLNNSVLFEAKTMSDHEGDYLFSGPYSIAGDPCTYSPPPGVQIEIEVSKPGYATRKRIVILKSDRADDPELNRYDFDFSNNLALKKQESEQHSE